MGICDLQFREGQVKPNEGCPTNSRRVAAGSHGRCRGASKVKACGEDHSLAIGLGIQQVPQWRGAQRTSVEMHVTSGQPAFGPVHLLMHLCI